MNDGPQQATIAPPLYSLKIYIKKEKKEKSGDVAYNPPLFFCDLKISPF